MTLLAWEPFFKQRIPQIAAKVHQTFQDPTQLHQHRHLRISHPHLIQQQRLVQESQIQAIFSPQRYVFLLKAMVGSWI